MIAKDNLIILFIVIVLMNKARPYLNRFVKIKEQQIEDSYHSINLREMKPVTSKRLTHNDTILINHSKRDMIKEVRDIEIERENRVLLQKISSVMSKKGSYSIGKTKNIRTKVNKSLNQFYRKRQMDEIQIENKRFVQRLQHKKPTLNIEKLNKDWIDNKSVIKRMANWQFNLTSIKSNSRVRSITAQKFYKSKYQKVKISKFKIIDGCKMLVRMEFIDDVLKITGDAHNSTDLKIIEIPKDEAVLLLEKDCQGKMENLIDKLRFDAKGDTLYLVTDDIEEGQLDFSQFNPEIDRIVNKKDERMKKQEKKASIEPSDKETTVISKKNQEMNVQDNVDKKEEIKQNNSNIIEEATPSKPQEIIPENNDKITEEHVVEKKEDEMKPQSDKYQEQKFEQSANNLVESKKEPSDKVEPEVKKESVKEAEQKETVFAQIPTPVEQKRPEIVVAPQEVEDYKQQFEEGDGKKNIPEEPKVEAEG